MKSRSHHRLPINNEPPDDWGDGSWTVDCVCGVNFDDGEEMVNCDECGVWVHTRCSRYVKGETSFACDKCKIKKYRNNDNEETEVAQLLVELPTKTMTMDHSRPSSAPPRSSFRLWTEIPMEERVHVQGLPGGDPALFQGLSSVFTSELWKCSGYVPKKFNFKYREFPCWDEKQQESSAKIDEDNENPVDRGADALFSLSKEIVSASPVEMLVGLRGSVERVSREKKSSKKEAKKRDRNDASDGYTHNAVTRDTNHLTSGIHLGKRKKDNIRFKDLSAKKKARSANKEADGRKRVPTTTIGAQQAELLKVGETKVVERGLQDSNNRDKTVSLDLGSDGRLDVNRIRPKDNVAVKVHYAGASFKKAKSKGGSAADVLHAEDSSKKAKPMHSLEANAEDCYKKVKPNVSLEVNVHHADEFSKKGKPKDKLFSKPHHAEDFTKKVKPKDNLATNAFHSGDTSKEEWRNSSLVEIVVKSENDHQAPTRTGSSSETVPIEVSLLEPNVTSINKKHEDFGTTVNCLDHLNDEKHVPGDLDGNSSNDVLTSSKLKPPVGDLRNVVTEVQDSGALPDSIKSTSASSLRPDIKVKSEANDDHLKGILSALSSSVDANQDSTKHLERHLKISVCEHPYEDVQVHEIDKSNFPSHEDVVTESRASSCCDKNTTVEGMIPISGEPCKNKEVIGSAGTLSVQESSSEPKHLKNVEDSSKTGGINASPLSPLTQRKVVPGFGKASSSSSSTVVISKSEVSGSFKPPGRPASPSTLRPIHFTKRVKVNSFGDIKKDHTVTDAVKDDFRHEEQRKTARDQLKASAVSAPKPSHMSRISHAYISKRTSSDSKGSVLYPNSKAPVAQNVAISSGSSESTSTLQSQNVSLLQNKTTALGFSEKGEKFNQLGSHHSSKVAQLSSMHPPAPVNSSSTLSDEELALLLHQELNSSPRVPRVPRMRHAGSIPQSASPTTTTMLMKCTSSSGVKDHISVSRKKSKEEAPKDGSHNSHELTDETKKIDRVLSSNDHRRQDQVITSDGTTKKEAHGSSEVGHSAKKNTPLVVNTTFGQSSSNEATDQNLSSWRNSSRDTSDDDDAGGIAGRATRTLPGLLDEIMSKGRRMTYEELCNAVLPHWNNLRKHNGERYAYSSHSQAVLDCLRNRNEWAQLVDRGPKTNAGRKKRKVESEPSPVEPEENEYSKSVSKNFEAHPEDFPKGKRKARKRRRLALQGRGIRDIRKRQKANALTDDDDLGQFSHSSDNDDIFSEDSQGARTRPVGSEASSSFEETGSM